jgi:hypothetical protein
MSHLPSRLAVRGTKLIRSCAKKRRQNVLDGESDFRRRAGAWLILSQSRQVNFSRTICTTFHCRGAASSVSVTSSPSLARRLEPQRLQVVWPGTIHALRGRCAGKCLRAGFLRVKARTSVVAAAFAAASSSSVAAASSSSS